MLVNFSELMKNKRTLKLAHKNIPKKITEKKSLTIRIKFTFQLKILFDFEVYKLYGSNKVMMIEIYLCVGNKKKIYTELKDDRK